MKSLNLMPRHFEVVLEQKNKTKPAGTEKARSSGQYDFAMYMVQSKRQVAPVPFIAEHLRFHASKRTITR